MANECSFGGEQGRHGRSTFFCGAKARTRISTMTVVIMIFLVGGTCSAYSVFCVMERLKMAVGGAIFK